MGIGMGRGMETGLSELYFRAGHGKQSRQLIPASWGSSSLISGTGLSYLNQGQHGREEMRVRKAIAEIRGSTLHHGGMSPFYPGCHVSSRVAQTKKTQRQRGPQTSTPTRTRGTSNSNSISRWPVDLDLSACIRRQPKRAAVVVVVVVVVELTWSWSWNGLDVSISHGVVLGAT